MLRATLVISAYKNTESLKVLLDSILYQTDLRFEIIVAEDGEYEPVKELISSVKLPVPINHITQPDLGWRKNHVLNKAVVASNTDYLVFIDEDCVLHPRFMEFHLKWSSEKHILAGKRVKLDPKSSSMLINGSLKPELMNRYLLQNFNKVLRNGGGFVEEGFFINPYGFLGFIPRFRAMHQLKGCNMSFSKKAIYAINGFDEDYVRPAIGEDIDLTWRFLKVGYRIKSIRNLAVVYHLYHRERWNDQSENIKMMLEKQSRNEFFCRNGLTKF